MMSIAPDSLVTVYGDTMAFLLLLGLLFHAMVFRHKKDARSYGLFTLLCLITMLNALSNGISYSLHHREIPCPETVRMIMPSIAEFSTLAITFLWLVYIDYKLYDSWERTGYVARVFGTPVALILLLFIVNIPTKFMFAVTSDFTFVSAPEFYIVTAAQYIYGILPIIAYIRYVINHGYKHFFHIAPVVIPTFVSALFTLLTSYSARAFGFAIAIVFLYCSYINRWRFDDDETGFYNRNYINHLKALARGRKADYKSAIIFAADYMAPELKEIFKAEVPKDGEIVRIEKDQLLLLSESTNVSMLEAMSGMIAEGAENYDREHPERPIALSSFYVLRKKNESSEEFIRRINGEIA